MYTFVWISFANLVILLVVRIILVLVLRKKWKVGETKETDYRTYFVMSVTFFPLGLVFMILSLTSDFPVGVGLPFFAMGIIYLIMSLSNRDKWKGNK